MYEAMEDFIAVPTWHTRHPEDERRFFAALNRIVDDEDFNADQMGEFFAQRLGLDNLPEDHSFNVASEHYVAAAWAVRRFLQETGR